MNQRQKQIKSIKPLTKEEFIKSYNYKIEFEMDKEGISNKIENKENMKDNNEYLDIYPNGKALKHLTNDDNEEEKKEPIKIEEKNEVVDTAKIEEIKKKDENNIVNIINPLTSPGEGVTVFTSP